MLELKNKLFQIENFACFLYTTQAVVLNVNVGRHS